MRGQEVSPKYGLSWWLHSTQIDGNRSMDTVFRDIEKTLDATVAKSVSVCQSNPKPKPKLRTAICDWPECLC